LAQRPVSPSESTAPGNNHFGSNRMRRETNQHRCEQGRLRLSSKQAMEFACPVQPANRPLADDSYRNAMNSVASHANENFK
jgi:hypothetical protein